MIKKEEEENGTQIHNSREKKYNDLDILLLNASRLFSQLKDETNRQVEKGKTKAELFQKEAEVMSDVQFLVVFENVQFSYMHKYSMCAAA